MRKLEIRTDYASARSSDRSSFVMPGAVQDGADFGREATRSTSKPIRALEALDQREPKCARMLVSPSPSPPRSPSWARCSCQPQSFNWFAPSRIDPFALMQAKKDLPHEQYDAH